MNLDATIYNKLDSNKGRKKQKEKISTQEKKCYDYNKINHFQRNCRFNIIQQDNIFIITKKYNLNVTTQKYFIKILFINGQP